MDTIIGFLIGTIIVGALIGWAGMLLLGIFGVSIGFGSAWPAGILLHTVVKLLNI